MEYGYFAENMPDKLPFLDKLIAVMLELRRGGRAGKPPGTGSSGQHGDPGFPGGDERRSRGALMGVRNTSAWLKRCFWVPVETRSRPGRPGPLTPLSFAAFFRRKLGHELCVYPPSYFFSSGPEEARYFHRKGERFAFEGFFPKISEQSEEIFSSRLEKGLRLPLEGRG